jgi:hypothetical protein
VWVCDLDLEESVVKEIDQLLRFFSCIMPTLTGFSKHAQRDQIWRMVHSSKTTVEAFWAMVAHCSSVEELQYIAYEQKIRIKQEKAYKSRATRNRLSPF